MPVFFGSRQLLVWREVRREGGGVTPSLRTSGCARDEGDLIREGEEVEDG